MNYCQKCGKKLIKAIIDHKERNRCPDDRCGFVDWNNPIPIVAAIVEHSDKIILVHSKAWPANLFGLVSGFLESKENPADAVKREIFEELSLESIETHFVGLYPFEQMNQLIIAYHVKTTGNLQLGDELDAFKQIPIEKLKAWPFGTGLAVQDWLEKRTTEHSQ